MNTVLALQETIGELTALNLHSDALYSCLVAFLEVAYRHLVAVSFRPSHIHSHEHLCPVLTLCAAGTGVYLEDTLHGVLLLAQHVLQFQFLQQFYRCGVVAVNLFFGDHFFFVEVEGKLQLVGSVTHLVIAVNPFLYGLDFLHLFFRSLAVFPEVGRLRAEVFFFVFYLLAVYVQIVVQCLCPLLDVL